MGIFGKATNQLLCNFTFFLPKLNVGGSYEYDGHIRSLKMTNDHLAPGGALQESNQSDILRSGEISGNVELPTSALGGDTVSSCGNLTYSNYGTYLKPFVDDVH